MMQITVNEFIMLYEKYEHMMPNPPRKFRRLSKLERQALKMMIFQNYLFNTEGMIVIASGGEHPLAVAKTEDYSEVPQEVIDFEIKRTDDKLLSDIQILEKDNEF